MKNTEKSTLFFLLLWIFGAIVTSPLFFHPKMYFNRGTEILQIVPFTFFLLVAVILGWSIWSRRTKITTLIGQITIICLTTSLLFSMVDRYFVSKNPVFQFINLTQHSTDLIATPRIFHFLAGKNNNGHDQDQTDTSYILIGDSFTVGSGSLPECNFPDVLSKLLKQSKGVQVPVYNFGISGTGPVNYRAVTSVIRPASGVDSFFIVTIFLGNDITDNLKGTYRRAVAGNLIQRFPDNVVIDWFNPINWHITRSLIGIRMLIKNTGVVRKLQNRTKACQFGSTPTDHRHVSWHQSRIGIVDNMKNNLPEFQANLIRLSDSLPESSHFLVVLFPDRLQGDRLLRKQMNQVVLRKYDGVLELATQMVIRTFGSDNVLNLNNTFSQRHYGADAIHLNDLGNWEAAQIVAEHPTLQRIDAK